MQQTKRRIFENQISTDQYNNSKNKQTKTSKLRSLTVLKQNYTYKKIIPEHTTDRKQRTPGINQS